MILFVESILLEYENKIAQQVSHVWANTLNKYCIHFASAKKNSRVFYCSDRNAKYFLWQLKIHVCLRNSQSCLTLQNFSQDMVSGQKNQVVSPCCGTTLRTREKTLMARSHRAKANVKEKNQRTSERLQRKKLKHKRKHRFRYCFRSMWMGLKPILHLQIYVSSVVLTQMSFLR